MKIVYLVGDGMGDYPVESLGNRTILQAADIPVIRGLAAAGEVRMVQTVPESLAPGSDVANLSLLGYDPTKNYTGRAPIEAAGAAIPMAPDDVAFRCNLVTIDNGRMLDYSAGHISTEEAHELIAAVQADLGRDGLVFHGGVSYRHLVIWKNGPAAITSQPPHDIADRDIQPYLPSGDGADQVRDLMERSKAILADHPVNQKRIAEGKRPATQIWLWGQGPAMQLEPYAKKFGLSGGVVSAVDLVRGLGILAGLEAPRIEGATGFIDTNFEGKVDAAMSLLARHPFVYVHIEAPDECGHLGDADLKKKAVELFESRVVKPIWKKLEGIGDPYRLIITMDHRTPVAIKGHTREPVPVAIVEGPTGPLEEKTDFSESVNNGQAEAVMYEWIGSYLSRR